MADNDPSDRSRPVNDAYTGMLLLSLLALVGGTVLLALDYKRYPNNPTDPFPKADLLKPLETVAAKKAEEEKVEEKKVEEKKDEEKQ